MSTPLKCRPNITPAVAHRFFDKLAGHCVLDACPETWRPVHGVLIIGEGKRRNRIAIDEYEVTYEERKALAMGEYRGLPRAGGGE